jgi:methionyl-tRNA formyltransferase
LPATPQPLEGVTYAHKIEKAEAPLDWQRPALELARRVRAFDPFPGANFSRQGEVIKAWAAQAVDGTGAPGEVLSAGPAGLVVACGEGALALTQLQRPGGRRLGVREFLAACPIAVGERLAN